MRDESPLLMCRDVGRKQLNTTTRVIWFCLVGSLGTAVERCTDKELQVTLPNEPGCGEMQNITQAQATNAHRRVKGVSQTAGRH